MSRHAMRPTEPHHRPTCRCGALTDNEQRWIAFLRDIANDGDPLERCCRTLTEQYSHHESMRLDGRHEQAQARPLPHRQLV